MNARKPETASPETNNTNGAAQTNVAMTEAATRSIGRSFTTLDR